MTIFTSTVDFNTGHDNDDGNEGDNDGDFAAAQSTQSNEDESSMLLENESIRKSTLFL